MSQNTQTQTTTPTQQTGQSGYGGFENPFDAIAYLLMIARLGMENANTEGELPRYVRIARAKEVIDSPQIPDWLEAPAEWAVAGVEGLNFFISRLITLTLQARDVLKGTDALLSLTEIALEMINVATSGEFWTAIGKALDPNDTGSVAIPDTTVIKSFESFNLAKVKSWLEYVPEPEDLDRIGHELYRMSCLAYNDDHTINIENTGRLRLLQYTFGQEWDVYLLNAYEKTEKLGQEEVEPFKGTTIVYNPGEGNPIVSLFTTDKDQTSNVNAILEKLEYESTDQIKKYPSVSEAQ